MMATKKAAQGAGTPAAAEGLELFDRHSTSDSILPQDEEKSTRIVRMIVENLCRLYNESTGDNIVVKSVRRRNRAKTE